LLKAKPRRLGGVSFRDDDGFVAEVPVLVGPSGARRPVRLRASTPEGRRGSASRFDSEMSPQDIARARANLEKLVKNHKQVMQRGLLTECLSFVWDFYSRHSQEEPGYYGGTMMGQPL